MYSSKFNERIPVEDIVSQIVVYVASQAGDHAARRLARQKASRHMPADQASRRAGEAQLF